MDVKIAIDEIACVGYGECVAVDAQAVALGADGVARVLRAEVPRDRAEALCASCPSGAIRIEG